jgi:hypothetical protein
MPVAPRRTPLAIASTPGARPITPSAKRLQSHSPLRRRGAPLVLLVVSFLGAIMAPPPCPPCSQQRDRERERKREGGGPGWGKTSGRYWPPRDAQPAQSEPVALFQWVGVFDVGRLLLGRPPRGLDRRLSGAARDSGLNFYYFFFKVSVGWSGGPETSESL